MPMSGMEMLKMYLKDGWKKVTKKSGTSHVKVRKGDHTEIIPMHKELKKGLESKLLKRLKDTR